MYFGLALFFKNNFLNEKSYNEFIKAFHDFNMPMIKYELLEKNTDKWKTTKNEKKVLQYLNEINYSSMIAFSNNECNGFSARLDSSGVDYYLPYDMQITIDKLNYNEVDNLNFSCIRILKPTYSYFVYNEKHKFIQEELSFTPISDAWLTGNFNKERENYLLSLQRRRKEIGKKVLQMYPVNYFLTSENVNILKDLKNKLDKNWIFEENGDYTIVKYKEMMPWEEFEKIRNSIKLN